MPRKPNSVTDNFEKEVDRAIPASSSLVLAVSGGIDSMCMLSAIVKRAKAKKLKLVVAHVNHCLREDSQRDEDLVRNFCISHEIECFVDRLEAKPKRENLELWARKARYSFFKTVLAECAADYIVTAHTASDLVETFLMRLLANKEPAGIIEVSTDLSLLRPLLKLFKSDVIAYQSEMSVPYNDDQTNSDTYFLRNRVRHELLPFLESTFEGNIEQNLYSRAVACTQDRDLITGMAEESLQKVSCFSQGSSEWFESLVSQLAQLPELLRWRFIELAFYNYFKFNIGRKHAKRIEEFLLEERKQVELPAGVRFLRQGKRVQIQTTF